MKRTPQYILITLLGIGATVALVRATQSNKVPTASPDLAARGKYLVQFGDCNACHTPLKMGPQGPEPDWSRMLSGHPADTHLPSPPILKDTPWFAATAGMTAWAGPWGISYAANITPDVNTGLGIWTEEMFIQAMRTGKHMGYGREILPPMPWQASSRLTEEDLKAIYAYLRSVPPIRNEVPIPVGADGPEAFD